MKPRLILLSDLFGEEKSAWKKYYINALQSHYDIKYYDCCVLGDIDKYDFIEKTLHEQYLNGGVETAVKKLLAEEKNPVHVLAFSIGGVIAWKSALSGLKVITLYAVSSTRLRHEPKRPKCPVNLLFAEHDYFVPDQTWFKKMDIPYDVMELKDHNMYMEADCARLVCRNIIKTLG